jgi:hypothetical protein
MRRSQTPLTASVLALFAAAAAPFQTSVPKTAPIPGWVLSNWEGLIGTWQADNQKYREADGGIEAYGIEWAWGLDQKSVIGRLYGIREGREAGTFWEFREFWHPGEGQLIAAQFGAGGTYGVGSHRRNADGTTEMLQTFYDPTTGAVSRVGHRSLLAGDEHTTRSFDVSDDGVWKDRRAYVWRRKK